MKLASLLRPRVILLALMLAAKTSEVVASMSCDRASEYRPISDPVVTRRIEERLQAIPAMKKHQVRRIDGQFAIAWQDEDDCRKFFLCYHLLLDIRNDAATVVFAYRGTGTVWKLGPANNMLSGLLDDDYSISAFETYDFDYIDVRLPRFLGPVWVGTLSPDEKSMSKTCARRKYE